MTKAIGSWLIGEWGLGKVKTLRTGLRAKQKPPDKSGG
jgi:hypothetical protein